MKIHFKHILFLLIGLVCLPKSYGQQDTQYTQYMYNPMSLNPAYTASRSYLSLLAMYRNQWVGISGAPQNFHLSAESPIGRENIGLGVEFQKDQIGPSDDNTLSGNFSYTISFQNETKLAFGLKGGITNLNINTNKLNIYDEQSVDLSLNDYYAPVLGAGFFLYDENWYIGLSTPNFLETKHYDEVQLSTAKEKMHLYLMGGYVFEVNPDFKLKPAALVRAVTGSPVAVDISTSAMLYDRFGFGVGYRLGASISAMASFKITDMILVGYSYDYQTSELARYNSGSHEIFLRFDILSNFSRYQTQRFF